MLDVGVDAKLLQARQLAEIEPSVPVLEMPATARPHLARRVAKGFKNELAGSIVVGVENDDAGTTPFGAAQARYINDVGFGIFTCPFGDGGQRRRKPPLSVPFSNRLFAASRHNGPAGAAHRGR